MNVVKKILIAFSVLLGIFILILMVLYVLPAEKELIEYNYANLESDSLMNSNVGWYRAENGKYYQVTWGSRQGLQLNFFDFDRNNLKHFKLTHLKNNQFDTDNNPETAEVRFISQDNNSMKMLEIKTSKTEFSAIKQPDTFYKQEEIEYFNGEVRLAGLLMTPYENSKSTAIVFIHGSGISDRDSFWYMHQADYLARNGFIVLLPDKRGCGKSTGEWHTASFNDFADDVIAALQYLSTNKQSAFSKKGIMGISQGGWISHIVNEKSNDLDFVIDVVGSSTTPNEQLEYEIFNDINSSGAPQFLSKPLSIVFAQRARSKRKIWWDKNGNFDPLSLMSNLNTPILKIFAAEDKNVPVAKSQEKIDRLLINEPNLPIEIKRFENSSHALFDKEKRWIRKEYLDYVNNWVTNL